MLFLMVLMIAIFCAISYLLLKKDTSHRVMIYLFIAGFTIYSGIGIILYNIKDAWLYFLNYVLFSLIFILVGKRSLTKKTNVLRHLDFVVENHNTFIILLSILYFLTFVYPLVYGGVTLTDFFDIRGIFQNYSATAFSIRLARRSNTLYTVITNQVRSICCPFFYLYLYKERKKILKFIILYLIPVYCRTLADGYISRNNLAVYAAFIIIYLVMEGVINKKIAILASAVGIPFVLALFYALAEQRLSGTFDFSLNSIWNSIMLLVESECSYPAYYDVCNSMTSFLQTLNYFTYLLVVCIPSQVYSLFGFTVPNLAYSFTEAVLGMSYGARDYYIVLPSVLGEATILFGKYFAWIYGGIYAMFVFWMLRVLGSKNELKYLKLYFMLDFFRQFRGGSQYVFSAWLTTMIPFIIIVCLLSQFKVKSGIKLQ